MCFAYYFYILISYVLCVGEQHLHATTDVLDQHTARSRRRRGQTNRRQRERLERVHDVDESSLVRRFRFCSFILHNKLLLLALCTTGSYRSFAVTQPRLNECPLSVLRCLSLAIRKGCDFSRTVSRILCLLPTRTREVTLSVPTSRYSSRTVREKRSTGKKIPHKYLPV